MVKVSGGVDVGVDGGVDGGVDVGVDVGVDGGVDVGVDVGVDDDAYDEDDMDLPCTSWHQYLTMNQIGQLNLLMIFHKNNTMENFQCIYLFAVNYSNHYSFIISTKK